MKAAQQAIFQALQRERRYQDEKWGATTTEGRHESLIEWFVYMQDYIAEALHVMSRQAEPDASEFGLHTMRKVTALGVAAMENCGVRYRADEGPRPIGYTEV